MSHPRLLLLAGLFALTGLVVPASADVRWIKVTVHGLA
jgi:hypothetical protein